MYVSALPFNYLHIYYNDYLSLDKFIIISPIYFSFAYLDNFCKN